MLCVPEGRAFNDKGEFFPFWPGSGQQRAGGAVKGGGDLHIPHGLQAHGEGGFLEAFRKALLYEIVPQKCLGPGQQVHIPENAAHAEFVLVF